LGQSLQVIDLDWDKAKEMFWEDEQILVPCLKGQELDHGQPYFHWQQKLKNNQFELSLVSYALEEAPKEDIDFLNKMQVSFDDQIKLESKATNAGSESYMVLHLFPYIRLNQKVFRINSITIEIKPKIIKEEINKDFVSNSVLSPGNGEWYKISVDKDGVYKISKAFLESCGIETQDLNPSWINIYGNGEGKLPELNSISRTDDLAKNAIFVSGEADGIFNDEDYILFYGWGPNRWYSNGSVEFDCDKNIYSDVSCYFININPNNSPKRIQSNSVSLPSNISVDTYSYFDSYENDAVNLVKGGQRWYGEIFDVELIKSFNFSIPNIDNSEPVNFKTAIATNASSTAGTEQKYSVNGNIIGSYSLPSISSDFITSSKSMNYVNPTANMNFTISITRNNPSTLVYLDRILINARRRLSFYGQQFNFRDLNSVGLGNVSLFRVSGLPTSGFVWDVTNRHEPKLILGQYIGSEYQFTATTDSLKEFVASNGLSFLTPVFNKKISNQNLHGLSAVDLLIVTHVDFISQANRLASLHESEGTSAIVVTTEQVFNEFSSGMLDPTAIKMFAKMFYDRALGDSLKMPKNLLLFGDGTYDPKNRISDNNNFVPTYQFPNGENHISAMVSDDYFGMLDDNESIGATDLLDIGIGRLLISDNQMAKEQVDKIEHYLKNGSLLFSSVNSGTQCSSDGFNSTFGDWRLNYVQIADDEEGGYFITQDTEPQYNYVKSNHSEMNCDKLYTDAYTQVSTAGGQRYPDVFDAISNRVERGALIVNYVGHGGEVGLAEERIVTVPQIQSWKNINRLNLFVSATCEFTKFDDPSRVSAGEWVSLNPNGGAIALMTTTRSVFFGVNTITGKRFYETVFNRDLNNDPLTFGEIMRQTKNSSGSSENKRSFTLIGDPALKIALPRFQIVTDSINGFSPSIFIDTVRALSKMTVKGHIVDYNENIIENFNGILAPSIYDKIKTKYTLGQDPESTVIPFELQKNIVYKGQVSITNGRFEFSFIVPKDIDFSFGNGKISYYGSNATTDGSGFDQRFVIGGIDPNGIDDAQGPEIQLFLNDENFVSGGITNETPVIFAKFYDENGINTVGNGIGHDITAIIDENSADPIILNEYYTADLDSYQSGSLRYLLPKLDVGKHTLKLKAWDVNNNSSEVSLEFVVQESEEVLLNHVLNYPNPFTTHTEFYFEHNQVCSQLETQIQILTVSGKLVKTINQLVNSEGFRSEGISWDGRDEFGDQLAKGVYIYTITVKTCDGKVGEKTEKLVLLK
jgi:hypothetical protein